MRARRFCWACSRVPRSRYAVTPPSPGTCGSNVESGSPAGRGATLDHGQHHSPGQRPPRQLLPRPVHALKQRVPPVPLSPPASRPGSSAGWSAPCSRPVRFRGLEAGWWWTHGLQLLLIRAAFERCCSRSGAFDWRTRSNIQICTPSTAGDESVRPTGGCASARRLGHRPGPRGPGRGARWPSAAASAL